MVGYCEVECGWVMVGEEDYYEEELLKFFLRMVLFFVIYVIKRGILEVWERRFCFNIRFFINYSIVYNLYDVYFSINYENFCVRFWFFI